MELTDVVLRRRMVRRFRPDPVSREKIERILSLALHAPSAGFSQGTAYVVVTDAELKKKISEVQGERQYEREGFHKFVSEAPVLVVACVSEKIYHDRYREPDKLREDGTEIEWPVPYWYFDIGCGCMIVFLAAVNEGLAAAFAGAFRPNELRALLGVPDDFLPVGTISIGYPGRDVRSPSLKRGRRPASSVIHYERW